MFQYNVSGLKNNDISSSLFVRIPDPTEPRSLISLYRALEDTCLAHSSFLPEFSKAILIEGDLLEVEISDKEFAFANWNPFRHLLGVDWGTVQGLLVRCP